MIGVINYEFNTKHIIIFCCLLLIQVFAYNIPILNAVITIIYSLILLYVLVIRFNINKFLLLTTIIFTTSFDKANFLFNDENAIIYSLDNVPFLKSGFLILISLIPGIIITIKDKNFVWIQNIKNKSSNLYLLFIFSFWSFILGIVFGISLYLIFRTSPENIYNRYIYDFLGCGLTSLYCIYFIYAILKDENFSQKLSNILLNIIASLIIVGFITISLDKFGYYGINSESIILMPLSFFFTTTLISFLSFKIGKKIFLYLLIIIAIYIQFYYANALGGKSWIVLAFVSINFIIYLIKYKKGLLIYIVPVLVILGLSYSFNFNENESSLNSNKLQEAYLFTNITSNNWYELLPLSPKFRVDEFINVFYEYKKQPYLSIFGKGYGGTTKDNLNLFGFFTESAFSKIQYQKNEFYSLHETVNVAFLKFGLFGLIFIILITIKLFQKIKTSPWALAGLVWLIFFWDYSHSLMFLGLPAMILAFYTEKLHDTY